METDDFISFKERFAELQRTAEELRLAYELTHARTRDLLARRDPSTVRQPPAPPPPIGE